MQLIPPLLERSRWPHWANTASIRLVQHYLFSSMLFGATTCSSILFGGPTTGNQYPRICFPPSDRLVNKEHLILWCYYINLLDILTPQFLLYQFFPSQSRIYVFWTLVLMNMFCIYGKYKYLYFVVTLQRGALIGHCPAWCLAHLPLKEPPTCLLTGPNT